MRAAALGGRCGVSSVDALRLVAMRSERGDDALDVFLVVCLAGDFEHDFFEAVRPLGLVVVELDDVRVLFGEDARDVEELAWLVWQLDAEAEDAAARDERFVDERGDRRDVDVAARDDGGDLLVLEWQLRERREREDARAFGDELVLLDEGE